MLCGRLPGEAPFLPAAQKRATGAESACARISALADRCAPAGPQCRQSAHQEALRRLQQLSWCGSGSPLRSA